MASGNAEKKNGFDLMMEATQPVNSRPLGWASDKEKGDMLGRLQLQCAARLSEDFGDQTAAVISEVAKAACQLTPMMKCTDPMLAFLICQLRDPEAELDDKYQIHANAQALAAVLSEEGAGMTWVIHKCPCCDDRLAVTEASTFESVCEARTNEINSKIGIGEAGQLTDIMRELGLDREIKRIIESEMPEVLELARPATEPEVELVVVAVNDKGEVDPESAYEARMADMGYAEGSTARRIADGVRAHYLRRLVADGTLVPAPIVEAVTDQTETDEGEGCLDGDDCEVCAAAVIAVIAAGDYVAPEGGSEGEVEAVEAEAVDPDAEVAPEGGSEGDVDPEVVSEDD